MRGVAHVNTAEGFFGILKRGINGVYHHVGRGHLWRYLSEFDYRYNHRAALGITDGERAAQLVRQVAGRRLTYQPSLAGGRTVDQASIDTYLGLAHQDELPGV